MSDVSRLLARVDELSAALAEAQRERDGRDANLIRCNEEINRLAGVQTELEQQCADLAGERDDLRALYRTVKANWEHQREFLEWLVRLDEPGNDERRTITLTEIIRRASAAVDTYETQTGGTE